MSLARHDHTSKTGKTWHTYYLDGRPVPGVTTILDRTLAKPELVDWAARMVAAAACDEETWYTFDDLAKTPDRIKREAAGRGRRVHAMAAAFLNGIAPGEPEDDIAGHWAAFQAWYASARPEPVAVECSVASRTWQVAGTVDLAAIVAGKRRLIDFKTGKKVRIDAALQVPAYRNMEVYLTAGGAEAPMADLGIEACQIVHLQPDGQFDVYDVDENEDMPWRVFQCLVWVHQTFKSVDGYDWLELRDSGAAVAA